MTHHEPRVEMKPGGAAVGSVDGGWWPRSLEPTTAFPELVSALHPWVGPVGRIAYNLGLWEDAPRKQTVNGRVVRYEGFRMISLQALFGDEPTGALDLSTGREVLALLRRFVDEFGATIVMVTHDPAAAAWADRVVILADGRVAGELHAPSAEKVAAQMMELTR